jgi:putative oxidoreductase
MRKWQKIISEAFSAILIFLFVYTALSKLINFHSFVIVLSKYPLIHSYSYLIAIVLPLVELLISALLSVQKHREKGFVISTFLMFFFTLYIAYMLAFTPELPCSCGGVLQSLGWKEHLIFNCFFMLLSIIGWLTESKNKIEDLKILLQ